MGDVCSGVFVHHNKAFRLPEDLSKDVIMVGPGTGVAPFRAFLEEREATEAPGRNWLFFGNPYQSTDFIYEEQIKGWVDKGVLSRLDLAFSRDQKEKIYVQDKMLESFESCMYSISFHCDIAVATISHWEKRSIQASPLVIVSLARRVCSTY